MGWQERNYGRDEGGGFRRAMRRIFVEGDNFFGWSLPLFTAWGVRVRIHIVYLIFIIGRLLMPIRKDVNGRLFEAIDMATLFALVLAHEFGHIFACRKVRGEADEILMWPLGGLAMCSPPHNWRAHLVTAIGGPAVNVLLIPVLGTIVFSLTRDWGSVIFNPFRPVLPQLASTNLTPYWLILIWSAHCMNIVLLGFNVLLPMYPMDGGRILQSLLWPRLGYGRSMWISTNIGLVGAVIMGVLAAMGQDTTLLAIAIFGGFVCFDQRRRLRFVEEDPVLSASGRVGYGAAERSARADEPRGPSRREIKERRREQDHQAEVDRILAKIRSSGMGSLTRAEQKTLRGETERKQRE